MLGQKEFFVHTPINLLISLLRDYLQFQAIFGIVYQKLQVFFFKCWGSYCDHFKEKLLVRCLTCLKAKC